MASPAHCFYCFECLDASFEHKNAPTLDKILDLFEKYQQKDNPDATTDTEEDEEIHEDAVDEDSRTDEDTQETDQDGILSQRSRPQLPSISRLQASTPSSRSSSASSPATVSASSSVSQLTGATSTTSISQQPSYASRLSVTESYPLFVTWNTISRSGHKSLRGCIGTFEGLPLASGLSTYALTSAFDDTRFSPIPSSLVPSLSCSLTLLANFEPCSDAMDWKLGVHGLRISFNWRGRRHGATYLPDVAVEQGWTKAETVESLMRKAGWDGGYGSGVARRLLRGTSRGNESAMKPWDEVTDFRAIRYTGLKSSASYQEWQDWKKWVEEQGHALK